jgi:N-acetylmuramoyl-L-alanine amidase CwlA
VTGGRHANRRSLCQAQHRSGLHSGRQFQPPGPLIPAAVTIHNTDNTNPGANAAAHARYQKGADARARQVSWHYTVDDRSVYQSLPTNEIGWHAGTAAGNATSIGVEICMNADLDEPAAYERAALLTALLAFQHGLGVPEQIKQHHDWSGKNCPRILRERPGAWKSFLDRVKQLRQDLTEVRVAALTLGTDATQHMMAARAAPKRAKPKRAAAMSRRAAAKPRTKPRAKPKPRTKSGARSRARSR